MPEGHTLHRLARQQTADLGGRVIRASSPQGRFVEGAARIDGRVLTRATAYGKHLFQHYAGLADVVHVHLGLYGKFVGEPRIVLEQVFPVRRGALRLRLETDEATPTCAARPPVSCSIPARSSASWRASARIRCIAGPTRSAPGPASSGPVRRSPRR
jgi:formamidopyrimidine-DNA glycosylase